MHEFLPSSVLIDLLASKAYPIPAIKEVCGNVMFLVAGFDEKNLNFVRQLHHLYIL